MNCTDSSEFATEHQNLAQLDILTLHNIHRYESLIQHACEAGRRARTAAAHVFQVKVRVQVKVYWSRRSTSAEKC